MCLSGRVNANTASPAAYRAVTDTQDRLVQSYTMRVSWWLVFVTSWLQVRCASVVELTSANFDSEIGKLADKAFFLEFYGDHTATTQYNTTKHSTAQHNITQHNITQHDENHSTALTPSPRPPSPVV